MTDNAGAVEHLRAEVEQLRTQVQHRDRALAQAREQQVASTAILRSIVTSGGDPSAVLAAITEHATRIGRAIDTLIYRVDSDMVSLVAHHGPFELPAASARVFSVHEHRLSSAAIRERGPIHVPDFAAVAPERFRDAWTVRPDGSDVAQRRTCLAVPLLIGSEAIGSLLIRRDTVAPFSDHEITAVEAFAAEAALETKTEEQISPLPNSVSTFRPL